jgi:hypothetical protein
MMMLVIITTTAAVVAALGALHSCQPLRLLTAGPPDDGCRALRFGERSYVFSEKRRVSLIYCTKRGFWRVFAAKCPGDLLERMKGLLAVKMPSSHYYRRKNSN